MIARLSTYDGPADSLDDLVGGMEKNTEALRGMQGFQGAYMLIDPGTGEAVTLTFWASEAAESASASEASRWRKDAADAADHAITDVHVYEVAVQVKARA
jgi:heme-degrading monooxygenase HmoA